MSSPRELKRSKHALGIACLPLLTLLLNACSFMPGPSEPESAPTKPWELRIKQLNALQHWEISGKIGVKTAEESQSAVINRWQQSGAHFEIDLSSSLLGLGNVKLEGSEQYLIITEAGEQPVFSSDPENLLFQQTHWQLPIQSLPYWAKGIPAPESVSSYQLDEANRLTQMEQSGWTIQYPKYQFVNGFNLPGKIVMTQGLNKITLIIKSWQSTSWADSTP